MTPRAEKPKLEITRVPIEQLKSDPENARTHGARNLASIQASLSRFGQRRPLVVTKSMLVVAGNGTLAAARELGWTHLDVTVLPWSDRARSRAFAIADNRTAELAAWDLELLGEQLQGLDDVDLEASGWLREEIPTLLPGPGDAPGDDPLAGHDAYRCPSCGHEWSGSPHPSGDSVG